MAKKKTKPVNPRFEEMRNQLAELNEEAILFDGYEEALIGACHQFGRPVVACYDFQKCLQILVKRDGMSPEDALEFFEFNTLGCYAGEGNPVFVNLFT